MTSTATAKGKARTSDVTPYQDVHRRQVRGCEGRQDLRRLRPLHGRRHRHLPRRRAPRTWTGRSRRPPRLLRGLEGHVGPGPRPHPVPAGRAAPRPPRRAGRARDDQLGQADRRVASTTSTTPPPATSTTAAWPPRSTARCCRFRPMPSPSPCGSRSAWPARSSPGTIRCSWPRGRSRRPSPPAAPSSSSPPSRRRSALLRLAEDFEAVGLPPGVVNVITGDGPVAGAPHRGAPPMSGRSPSPAAPRSASSSCGAPPTSSSGCRSSWAASRPTSSSATPTSRTRWTARSSAPSSTRARSARPAAGCWCRRTSTRSSSTPPRPRPRPSGWARAWTATPRWARW